MHIQNRNLTFGLHVLAKRKEKAIHMDMDLMLFIAKPNENREFFSGEDEMAILLLEGEAEFQTDGIKKHVKRESLFNELGSLVHVYRNKKVSIKTLKKSEFLIIKTGSSKFSKTQFYDSKNVHEEFFGEDVWDNTALRRVRTYFDYSTKPESNLVVGEVITYPGRWSSFLPHYHPQPELYFFKFDKESGFGISIAGENAYIVKDNDINAVPANLVHPVSAAPGYPLYYCWLVRNLENNPWTQRIEPEEHQWLKDPDVKYWKKGVK